MVMSVTTKYLQSGLKARLAAAAALALASTTASAVLAPMSDSELSAQHAAGLTLPGLDAQSGGQGASAGDALSWLRSQQDLLKALEHQQQAQTQQRLATASLQISSSVSYSIGLASLATPLGGLFLPLMALPTPQLVALLPPKDAKASPPKGH
jgi:hypothetical protein